MQLGGGGGRHSAYLFAAYIPMLSDVLTVLFLNNQLVTDGSFSVKCSKVLRFSYLFAFSHS